MTLTILLLQFVLSVSLGVTEFEGGHYPPCVSEENAPAYMADAFADYYVPGHAGFNDSETVWCEEGLSAPKIGAIITL